VRILVALAIDLVAGCDLVLSPTERTWCAEHAGSVALAAEELGRIDEMIKAEGALQAALAEGPDEAALDVYYSEQAIIASCRLAYDSESRGRPFVP
jgi:hypothetical protein